METIFGVDVNILHIFGWGYLRFWGQNPVLFALRSLLFKRFENAYYYYFYLFTGLTPKGIRVQE